MFFLLVFVFPSVCFAFSSQSHRDNSRTDNVKLRGLLPNAGLIFWMQCEWLVDQKRLIALSLICVFGQIYTQDIQENKIK
ncbi:hypothetical protein ASPWEDRAFT_39974 [Aspergillus wentii DTO 134E9]|uniref:Secreted protein n=1 Tax=Aspergillus wentii DTO 134E9 TaxID=1073089 RepID=A0A1L9RIZ1_ASPWE|nr:uncharacterized protein ASPWEDRAFT_39974 [Aspergillus wentii DTO 134E9]OJJ34871.1 hypothetical protein ASPWEDRAFT_39974 [Aspergillus wentii DTO 134E9]